MGKIFREAASFPEDATGRSPRGKLVGKGKRSGGGALLPFSAAEKGPGDEVYRFIYFIFISGFTIPGAGLIRCRQPPIFPKSQ